MWPCSLIRLSVMLCYLTFTLLTCSQNARNMVYDIFTVDILFNPKESHICEYNLKRLLPQHDNRTNLIVL